MVIMYSSCFAITFAVMGNIHSSRLAVYLGIRWQAQEETGYFGKGATHLRRDGFFTLYTHLVQSMDYSYLKRKRWGSNLGRVESLTYEQWSLRGEEYSLSSMCRLYVSTRNRDW